MNVYLPAHAGLYLVMLLVLLLGLGLPLLLALSCMGITYTTDPKLHIQLRRLVEALVVPSQGF